MGFGHNWFLHEVYRARDCLDVIIGFVAVYI